MAGKRRGIDRREFLKAAAGAGAAAAAGMYAPRFAFGAPERKLPNLVFVFADQHRAASVGCYGDKQVRTPHMDKLAGQGMRMTSAISNTPICCPYRASLMTGTNTPHNRVLNNGLLSRFRPDPAKTFGTTFRKAGYKCGYVGKWHLGPVDVDPGPRRLGFDDYWAANVSEHRYDKWTYYTGKDEVVRGSGFYRPKMETDLAINWMQKQKNQPFCLFLSWGPPHNPWKAPAKYHEHYRDMKPRFNVPDEKAESVLRRHRHYNGLIEGLDVELGRLMSELDRLGIADDTILVYTSDHGEMMGSYGWYKKRRPYQESLEVPFIVRFPDRIKAGTVSNAVLSAHDVFPTLAAVAGLDTPAGLDGQDLSGVLLGKPDATKREYDYLTLETDRKYVPSWQGVRTERYTYSRTADGPWILFDQQDDPGETRNLVKENAKLVKQFDALTSELCKKNGDRWY
jgi:arylsulfatase A-like enzyme